VGRTTGCGVNKEEKTHKKVKKEGGVEERVCGNVGVACASLIITLEYQCQLLYAFSKTHH